ncbi:MAG: hypothetical protein ACOCZS_04085 [Verrucomicrobiota bacterium]
MIIRQLTDDYDYDNDDDDERYISKHRLTQNDEVSYKRLLLEVPFQGTNLIAGLPRALPGATMSMPFQGINFESLNH